MARSAQRFAYFAVACTLSIVPLQADVAPPREPENVSAFELSDAQGGVRRIEPTRERQLTVICFLGTECPLARKYAARLNELTHLFRTEPVRFLGVNSNSQDSQTEVDAFSGELQLTFPVFKDPGNKLADLFGARHMTEVFVLDETLSIRYRGRIDDQHQPGVSRGKPSRDDLRIALEELLADQVVGVPRTESTGCLIGRIKPPAAQSDITYCRQVSRIVAQHCVECHRPGEIGPFSLTDYEEVRGWGETIVATIAAGRMPPWNANPRHGAFRNARVMSDADKRVLADWVQAGMPYGNEADLAPPLQYSSGWQLPSEPDLVVAMRDKPFRVPASGTVEYQYFVVDPNFEQDQWVSAAQVIPGSRATVHHCIVFVRPPDGSDVRGVGYLTGYVPGQRSFALPPGSARKVPAGSKFVFQMHYTPNGTAQDDITQVGLTRIPEAEVTHEVFTLLGINQDFEIAPHASAYPVHGTLGWFPRRAELLAMVPHMHVRGKAVQVRSRRGDEPEILLDVPRYDFNWQHVYELNQPKSLAELDALEFTAVYDNSRQNPANPDPTQTVTWGDQTWEEMAVVFFEVAAPRHGPPEPEPVRNRQKLIVRGSDAPAERNPVLFVQEFFARFDRNQDDLVERHETPLLFQSYGFRCYDANGDGKLSREEVESAAERTRRRK